MLHILSFYIGKQLEMQIPSVANFQKTKELIPCMHVKTCTLRRLFYCFFVSVRQLKEKVYIPLSIFIHKLCK